MGSFLSSPATDADLLASPDAYDSRSLRKSEGYSANHQSSSIFSEREREILGNFYSPYGTLAIH